MSHTYEGDARPDSGIRPFRIDKSNLPSIEAYIADAMHLGTVVVSPNVWVVDPATEERLNDQVALGGICNITELVIGSDPLYKGILAVSFGVPEEPDAMAIVSPTLRRRGLEATRNEVVGRVNGLLAKLQSPYRL